MSNNQWSCPQCGSKHVGLHYFPSVDGGILAAGNDYLVPMDSASTRIECAACPYVLKESDIKALKAAEYIVFEGQCKEPTDPGWECEFCGGTLVEEVHDGRRLVSALTNHGPEYAECNDGHDYAFASHYECAACGETLGPKSLETFKKYGAAK